jgi:hypothetical protein
MAATRTAIAVPLGTALALALLGAAARTPAEAARGRIPCAPARLNNSALLAGAVTVSPLPGSRDASPRTQVSFLGVPAAALSVASVIGSRTGPHPGRLLAYSQGDGASFVSARPFAEGERVTVRARVRRGQGTATLVDQFAVARHDPISKIPLAVHPVGTVGVQSYISRPDLHPPAVTVSAQSPAAAPGDVFLAPYSGPGQAGPMILDPAGALVWFKPLPVNTSATNLQVQQYLGEPVLAWWQGNVTGHGFGLGVGVIADGTYTEIAHVSAGNGYSVDLHELQLTPQGSALITVYDSVQCGLSAVGGPAGGAILNGILQDIDIKTGLVRFQWTGLDHVALADSYELARKATTAWPFDFFHINSIEREGDGSLLVSARNTWATYDIDARSGRIVWQLGGKRSSFALSPGAGAAWQHDARQLPDGAISIFDNGAAPAVHRQSRGVVLSLNQSQRTATLRSQIINPTPILAASQGNMQALAGGDWFVGWGQVAAFSEYDPRGQLVFAAHMPAHVESYRAFRLPWQGAPAQPPEFAVQPVPGGPLSVHASWNGATRVAAWSVLAGPTATSLHPVARAPRAGFETAIALPAGTTGPYVTVQALDATGAVLGTAAVKTLTG